MNNLKTNNREQWLINATNLSRKVFKQFGYNVPNNIKFSCSFPANSRVGAKLKAIGQCIDPSASNEKHFNILIHPAIEDKLKVLGILVHELCHATVGIKNGHNHVFKKCANTVGLEGQMRSTTTGDLFNNLFKDVLKALPDYPHGAVILNSKKKQTTRMLKLMCGCGCIVRMSNGAYEKFGAPICGTCGEQMELA